MVTAPALVVGKRPPRRVEPPVDIVAVGLEKVTLPPVAVVETVPLAATGAVPVVVAVPAVALDVPVAMPPTPVVVVAEVGQVEGLVVDTPRVRPEEVLVVAVPQRAEAVGLGLEVLGPVLVTVAVVKATVVAATVPTVEAPPEVAVAEVESVPVAVGVAEVEAVVVAMVATPVAPVAVVATVTTAVGLAASPPSQGDSLAARTVVAALGLAGRVVPGVGLARPAPNMGRLATVVVVLVGPAQVVAGLETGATFAGLKGRPAFAARRDAPRLVGLATLAANVGGHRRVVTVAFHRQGLVDVPTVVVAAIPTVDGRLVGLRREVVIVDLEEVAAAARLAPDGLAHIAAVLCHNQDH